MIETSRGRLIRDVLQSHRLDALLCALPANVLMLSGYWPVVGTALALARSDGRVALCVPDDEAALLHGSWAHLVNTFSSGSLADLRTPADAVVDPLRHALDTLELGRARIGLETMRSGEPASYVAMNLYQWQIREILLRAAPTCEPLIGDGAIRALRCVKTAHEIGRIAEACRAAGRSFETAATRMSLGLCEAEVAELFRATMTADPVRDGLAHRAPAHVACMSGPNAARAHGSHARSTGRFPAEGELCMVHCNACLDGYWTDITRTYVLGEFDGLQRKMIDALFEARDAALEAIRPGAVGTDVDAAARDVLRRRGFGEHFLHPLGHGVGFGAIGHDIPPRLHPASTDVLEPGMVFVIEPAIYLHANQGMRHADVVMLADDGPRVLTPFHDRIEQLTLEHATVSRSP